MSFTRAEAFAPATMANLGVGFDILGLALCEPGDIVCVARREQPGVSIVGIEGDGGVLTHDSRKNTASVAANAFLQMIDAQEGVEMTVYKHLPLASGLGSSAASAVAAVVAVNALFGSPLTLAELLPACLEGEACVSGYHADNVAPSLFGGITLVMGVEVGQIHSLPVPPNLHLALVTPNIGVPTAEARAVLPKMIPLHAMVTQTAAVARLVSALYRGDIEEMADAMEQDTVIEPARAHLMPMLAEVRAAAKKAGALGMVISGAGPTLCAICDNKSIAKATAAAMKAIYSEAGMDSAARHTQVGIEGAHVLNLA
jgi:homoserine kinase